VTAEFAVLIPAVIVVLACCLGGLRLAGDQLRLQDAAGMAARTIARGESVGLAASRAASLVPGAAISSTARGDLDCVVATASGSLGAGLFGAVTLSARSCALGGDPVGEPP